MNEFNALERKAGLLTMQGMQQQLFTQRCLWRRSLRNRQATKSWRTFTSNAFLPTCAWLMTHGWHRSLSKNPNADSHPFVPKLYENTRDREAAELNAKAAGSLQEMRRAGSVSCQYLANTVLFATVLFFVSASGRFEHRRVRLVAFAFAVAVFLFAVVRTALLPR